MFFFLLSIITVCMLPTNKTAGQSATEGIRRNRYTDVVMEG